MWAAAAQNYFQVRNAQFTHPFRQSIFHQKYSKRKRRKRSIKRKRGSSLFKEIHRTGALTQLKENEEDKEKVSKKRAEF